MSGVMNGLKVLDLSWGIAGPMTAMLLGDHGADITRIERPQGDPFKNMLGYKVWHRGKKNAVFDLKNADDLELFYKLAADADVLIESFSPRVTSHLKIDYDTLAALNPKLIYCSVTAYGDDTPDAERKGYDSLVAAKSGLQYEQRGWPEGSVKHMNKLEDPFSDIDIEMKWRPGPEREGPLNVSSPWPSLGAFFSLSTALAAALYARENTGKGQHVKTSLHQGAMVCGSGVWQRAEDPFAEGFDTWIMNGRSPKGHYECKDGRWIHNWVPNPRFILEASRGEEINATPDLTVQNDPDRFGVGPEEILVIGHYQPILADAIKKFTCQEWVDAAATAGITIQECRSIEESLIDELLINDGCVTTVEDEELGPINQVGISYRLETSPGQVQGPARKTGADTDAVKEYASGLPMPAKSNQTAPTNEPPLKGIRVLDLGLAIAGPFGTQILSDLGAEVIKINALWDGYWHKTHIAAMANRGKRSIALMLKNPKAMEILKKLIASCDVVQHNMRYAATTRMGLDYETLKKEFPKLIYCHSRGFEKGPRMDLPGNDQTGACLSGIQYSDGAIHDGGKPMWSLTSLGDTGNGFLTAIGICNALLERKRTGKGQFVDTSIINAGLLNTSYAIATPDGKGFDRPLLDKDHFGFGLYNRLYKTSDGWVQIAALSAAEKSAFNELMGIAGEADLDKVVETLSSKSTAECMAMLDDAKVPAEISDPEASLNLFDNQDFKKRGWTAEYPEKNVGKIEQIGVTYNMSDTPPVIQSPPLIVGQHTAEILAELGYSEADIDELANDMAIMCDPPREGQKEMENPWGL